MELENIDGMPLSLGLVPKTSESYRGSEGDKTNGKT
jgi:hypothetical protein